MKKFLFIFSTLLLLAGCSKEKTDEVQPRMSYMNIGETRYNLAGAIYRGGIHWPTYYDGPAYYVFLYSEGLAWLETDSGDVFTGSGQMISFALCSSDTSRIDENDYSYQAAPVSIGCFDNSFYFSIESSTQFGYLTRFEGTINVRQFGEEYQLIFDCIDEANIPLTGIFKGPIVYSKGKISPKRLGVE